MELVKLMGYVTITIPPSGCGNEMPWNARTTQEVTAASGMSEPPFATFETDDEARGRCPGARDCG